MGKSIGNLKLIEKIGIFVSHMNFKITILLSPDYRVEPLKVFGLYSNSSYASPIFGAFYVPTLQENQ
jgi:hypothetical protein